MATVVRKPRRVRPEDGGMAWRAHLHAFECLGCAQFEEVHSRRRREDPEWMMRHQELLILDHTECWKFDDPKMAADARKYRKEKTRRENLKARAAGVLDRMSVAPQRASWRGGA